LAPFISICTYILVILFLNCHTATTTKIKENQALAPPLARAAGTYKTCSIWGEERKNRSMPIPFLKVTTKQKGGDWLLMDTDHTGWFLVYPSILQINRTYTTEQILQIL